MTEENETGSDTRLQTVISFFFQAFLLLFPLVLAISRVFSSFLRVLYVSVCHCQSTLITETKKRQHGKSCGPNGMGEQTEGKIHVFLLPFDFCQILQSNCIISQCLYFLKLLWCVGGRGTSETITWRTQTWWYCGWRRYIYTTDQQTSIISWCK